MIKEHLRIENIPAMLWGAPSDSLFLAVHGNMSHKADEVMEVFAEEATAKGHRVLSFDLPEHGDRAGEPPACKVQNCVQDLDAMMAYARSISREISMFACSMGAYFSLLVLHSLPLRQCLFLSPVLDMERIIDQMMAGAGISESRLKAEKEIPLPLGPTLYWDYYCYVKGNPIVAWEHPTSILYGSADNLCEHAVVSAFAKRFGCDLQVLEQGEHYFHTEEQLRGFRQWLKRRLSAKDL